MPVFKCKMCGAVLNVSSNATTCTCDYCDSVQTIPQLNGEKKINLFTRANRLRAMCDFDSAATVYQNLVSEFPNEAEAYWGLCLCKFGIEYVEDPLTGKMVPTCHRTMYESIFDDHDFKMALSKADGVSRGIYEGEASSIDQIQQRILDVVKDEKPYDVFICYKKSDENKDRTKDSVRAQEIYENLTAKGMKVFFAEITLEGKLGVDYEPYIFAALQSAKVMLVVTTSVENVNGVWVKNEWSRFLRLMQTDKSKMLIPCFEDMDPEELPAAMKGKQAQDMSKIGFMQDLVRGVVKVVGAKSTGGIVPDREMTLEDDGMVAEMKRHADGEALISRITSIGHNDSNNSWPQGAITSTVDIQKNSVIQFFINLRRPIGVNSNVEFGFMIYDSNGNTMLDATGMMYMQREWDRFSKGWILKGSDGTFVQPGIYWAVFWMGNSQAMRYRFNVIDSSAPQTTQQKIEEQKYVREVEEALVKEDIPDFEKLKKKAKLVDILQKILLVGIILGFMFYFVTNLSQMGDQRKLFQEGVGVFVGVMTFGMSTLKNMFRIKDKKFSRRYMKNAIVGIAYTVVCSAMLVLYANNTLTDPDAVEIVILSTLLYCVIEIVIFWIAGVFAGKILRWIGNKFSAESELK